MNDDLIKVAALLVHTAKIDGNYSIEEEDIIKQALLKFDIDNQEVQTLVEKAKAIEENSNQILDFTREVKNVPDSDKIKIIESLWKIIYSNDSADIYETNLMRRLSGLLYVDAKTMGDLKLKVKSELRK